MRLLFPALVLLVVGCGRAPRDTRAARREAVNEAARVATRARFQAVAARLKDRKDVRRLARAVRLGRKAPVVDEGSLVMVDGRLVYRFESGPQGARLVEGDTCWAFAFEVEAVVAPDGTLGAFPWLSTGPLEPCVSVELAERD